MSYYSYNQLASMDSSFPWSNCIKSRPQDLKPSSTDTYTLHATGDADLDGRKYIPLPADTKITPEIKRKYNLI
mgnify:CR=1 FL=1|tara:strand:- start:128 stop:346 length:219 start_codon:yes stop_codon:yes gene_type:complete